MSDKYAANGQVASVAASPGKSALGLNAVATRRARVFLVVAGCDGTPIGDNILNWLVRRFTAVGTATPVTPEPLEGGGLASAMTAETNYTSEPTWDAGVLFNVAVHQRATWQWQSVPGREIVIAAVAGNGLAVTPQHGSYSGTARATLHWEE